MDSADKAGRTSVRVARMATRTRGLNRGNTDLIGVFGPQNNMSALIRNRNGEVRRVERGQNLPIGRVIAIDKDGMMVEKNGTARRMTLPAG